MKAQDIPYSDILCRAMQAIAGSVATAQLAFGPINLICPAYTSPSLPVHYIEWSPSLIVRFDSTQILFKTNFHHILHRLHATLCHYVSSCITCTTYAGFCCRLCKCWLPLMPPTDSWAMRPHAPWVWEPPNGQCALMRPGRAHGIDWLIMKNMRV